jgi:cytochrome d ubiquinol oxidase subunit I
MESLFRTTKGAPLLIGGWPDPESGTVSYGLEIPYGLSILAFNNPQAEVQGLESFPKDERPPVEVVHTAFQVMVGIGTLLALVSVTLIWRWWRSKEITDSPVILGLLASLTPLGFIALEAGWVVTEVGRQPWIIYRILRTEEALTPMPGIVYTFAFHALVYLGLVGLVSWLMVRQIKGTASKDFCYRLQ